MLASSSDRLYLEKILRFEACHLKDLPFVEIHIGFLADQVGVTASHTLDFSQGVHDLLLAIDVGVKETEDKLEVRLLPRNERYGGRTDQSILPTRDVLY